MYRAPVNYLPHLMFGFQRSCVTKVSDGRVERVHAAVSGRKPYRWLAGISLETGTGS